MNGDDPATMLAYHAAWKQNPPYFRVLLGLILLTVPLALFQLFTEDVIGLCARGKRTRRRHAIGVISLLLLCSAITTAALLCGPMEARLASGVSTGDNALDLKSGEALELCEHLWKRYLILVLLNVMLLILPFMKFNASQPAANSGASADTVASGGSNNKKKKQGKGSKKSD